MQDITVLIDGKLYSRETLSALPRQSDNGSTDVRTLARWLHSNSPAHSKIDLQWVGQTGKFDLIEFCLSAKGPLAGTYKKPEQPKSEARVAEEAIFDGGNGFQTNGNGQVLCDRPVATMTHNGSQETADASALIQQAIGLIAGQGRSTVNVEQLEAFRESLLADVATMIANGPAPIRVEVVGPTPDKKVPAELAHKAYPKLIEYIDAREHVALVGPAGGGKSEACRQAADALGLDFFVMSMGPETTQTEIKGYFDMQGEYVRTPARDAVEHGGLLLMDEFDCGNEGVGTCINGMTSNKVAGFPGGKVKVHPNFICVLAMNTFGHGADRIYIGRNELDGATLDRFPTLYWDYDPAIELELSPNREWALYVQRVRAAVDDLKIKHVVSMRASIRGGKMINRGKLSRQEIEDSYIWKGLAKKEIDKVKAALGTR